MTPELICIVGPTAIGKTAFSLKLAQHYSTEILSADSRQFYREMSIGTAVPSEEELKQAKHHFIQHISIHDNYNVGKFEQEALKILHSIFEKKNKAILVGGSGLYQKAVTAGLDRFPEIPQHVRDKYNTVLEQHGVEALQTILKEKDMKTFNSMDTFNPRRLTRALEIIDVSGKPPSFFQNQNKVEREFNTIKIGLDAPRAVIYERIEQRVDNMIAQGLVDEASSLYSLKHLNALQTVGYRELFNHFDGDITLTRAIEDIKKNTRRFAKRQLTWFKKDPEIQWFHYKTPMNDILQKFKTQKD
jgi:tRNA dimethylallyltransferase